MLRERFRRRHTAQLDFFHTGRLAVTERIHAAKDLYAGAQQVYIALDWLFNRKFRRLRAFPGLMRLCAGQHFRGAAHGGNVRREIGKAYQITDRHAKRRFHRVASPSMW